MRSLLRSVIWIAISAVGIPAHADPVSVAPRVNVATIVPLTGEAAFAGVGFRNGVTLGFESLPASVQQKLALHFEDDQNKPAQSVTAFRKLTDEGRVDVLIGFTAQPSLALAPLAEENHTPMLSVSLVRKVVEGRRYVFSFFASPEGLANALVNESLKRGYKNVARVNSIHDGSIVMAREFDAASAGRLNVVKDIDLPLSDADFRTEVLSLKSAPPFDAIYLNVFFTQAGGFAKQLRALGVNAPVFNHLNFQDVSQVRTAQGALEGAWYVYPVGATDEFYSRYRARFSDGNEFLAYNGYETVRLVGKLVEQGASGRESLREGLAGIKEFPLQNGVARNLGDQRIVWPVCVKEVRGEGFTTVSCERSAAPVEAASTH